MANYLAGYVRAARKTALAVNKSASPACRLRHLCAESLASISSML